MPAFRCQLRPLRKQAKNESKEEGCGTPTDAGYCCPHANGVRHAPRNSGLRRPPLAGALACRRSTAALAKESISSPRRGPGHASWEAVSTGRGSRHRHRSHFQRCTSRAGRNAGRLMPEPPECAADEATPAGTALAPLRPASPGRRPFRASFDSSACIRNGDDRQVASQLW